MQEKFVRAILFSLLLLVSLGCNSLTQVSENRSTPTVQDTPTPTPTPGSPLPSPGARYKVTGKEGIATYSGIICDLEKPFSLKATTDYWEMDFELTPSSAHSGTFTITGTHFEAGPYTGEGTYVVSPLNEEMSQLSLNFTSLIQHLKYPGPVDINPGSYHPTLVPLDAWASDCK